MAAAVLAPTVTIISTLLALGVIQPFERGKAEALADSQASTLAAGTAKIRIDVHGRGGDYTAVGAYDFREGRGRFTYNFTNLPNRAGDAAVEARFFQNAVYVHRPEKPRSARWLLVNLDRDLEDRARLVQAATGDAPTAAVDVAEAKVEDPTAVLSRMAAAGAVLDRGESRSLGAELHEYSGTLPAAHGDGKPPRRRGSTTRTSSAASTSPPERGAPRAWCSTTSAWRSTPRRPPPTRSSSTRASCAPGAPSRPPGAGTG
ncbi:MAG TPA: hypothetical protein VF533_02345 [Solirubrobacteraceae bacterium]